MKRGFGTKFHDVYSSSPELYHEFSRAEKFSPDLKRRIQELLTGDTLLDVACGTCHKTNQIAKYFETVYALDKSEKLLMHARDLYGSKNICFLHGVAENLPFLDESIDSVFTSWGAFRLNTALEEMQRVLKPGGMIVRIGVVGLDEFTALFPKLDLKRIAWIKKQFENMGFVGEEHTVTIKFSTLRKAKSVLSKVLGINKSNISKAALHHRIILYYYKKPAHDNVQN